MVRTEIWLPIEGFRDSYEISSHGRVRSIARSVNGPHGPKPVPGTIMKLHEGGPRAPHLRVKLWQDNKQSTRLVHRLVLEAFVGPCPDKMVACHTDGNPHNNHVDNLRWDTESSNAWDSVRHRTHQAVRKTHCKHGHEFTEANIYRRPGRPHRACRTCRAEASRSRSNAA